MKNIITIIFLIFCLSCISSQRRNNNEVYSLTIKDNSICSILEKSLLDKFQHIEERNLIILNINNSPYSDSLEVRQAMVSSKNFNLYINDLNTRKIKTPSTFGHLSYKNKDVIVLGNASNVFFQREQQIEPPEYLKLRKSKYKRGHLSPPPMVLEPKLTVYSYKDGHFINRKIETVGMWLTH